MSRAKNYAFTCPCGEVFDVPIYEYVNVVEEPRLRYAVLAGLLNVATCPSCGRRAATTRPFVYADFPHDLLAYVHPQSDAPEEARQLILERLRDTYLNIVDVGEEQVERCAGQEEARGGARTTFSMAEKAEIPPLRVLFGQEQLAREMDCLVEVEDLPDEYTVWLYGSRRQIGAIMRELALRG
jgi:hypothetical protein